MQLPAEQVFDSRDLLFAYVREHAISQGYAVTTIRSEKDKKIYLGCDRGGTYHDRVKAPEGAKRRFTTTRRIGCPFRLYGKKVSGDKWELQVQNSSHNHPTDDNMIAHPTARRFTGDQLQNIHHMSEIGLKPCDIRAMFSRQYPDALVTSRDIYNARSALRRQKLDNSTPLQTTVKKRKQDKKEQFNGEQAAQRRKKAPPKCTTCGTVGHTRRSCK